MKEVDRQTRSYLMELFQQHGFHPRSDLGQNFLIDINILEYIVREAQLGPQDVVLEVGTGTGGLTAFLAREAGAVVSVESDRNMHALAREQLQSYSNLTLLKCDALKNKNTFAPQVLDTVNERLAEDPQRRLKLVANLPYNIATSVVSNLVATELPWERMVVTIQWELALRMTAQPGTSQYGALSAWLQSQTRIEILKKLKPTVFWPRPQVDSGIVLLRPDSQKQKNIKDRPFFQDFLRRLFTQRRKLLRPVVAGMYRKRLSKADIDAILQQMDMKETDRAEELKPEKLVLLANRIEEAISQKSEH